MDKFQEQQSRRLSKTFKYLQGLCKEITSEKNNYSAIRKFKYLYKVTMRLSCVIINLTYQIHLESSMW